MARMDHVVQIGEPGKFPQIYLEDYAYTFLKRQNHTEKKKYYLFGEREGREESEKLYIYGIADSAKEQSTYFKNYQSLGFLKIQNGEKMLVNQKGQETAVTGFFVFYAPNQDMQEYLVDTNTEKKEQDILREKPARQFQGKKIPIKEKIVLSVGKNRKSKQGPDFGNLVFYAGCIAALLLLVTAVAGGNGFGKLSRLRQMVLQTMNGSGSTQDSGQLVVEERKIGKDVPNSREEASDMPSATEPSGAVQADPSEMAVSAVPSEPAKETPFSEAVKETISSEEIKEANVPEESVEASSAEEPVTGAGTESAAQALANQDEEPEVYVVQEGDTLAQICVEYYGDPGKMADVCEFNNIENEDHIAPGQKLYLPK